MSRLKLSLNIILASLTLVLGILSCFFIAENFFYDKIFYKKSALHGYFNRFEYGRDEKNVSWLNKQITLWRERDLKQLLNNNFSQTPKKDTKTIVVIGDSYTYGVGVLPHERFSSQLGPELKKLGIKAIVYNFSEPGNSIIDDYALYLLSIDQLKPDVIIINTITNDLIFNAPRYYGTSSILNELNSLCAQPLYEPSVEKDVSEVAYANAEIESFSLKNRNRCYLEQITAKLSHDPRIMFFGFTAFIDLNECSLTNNYREIALSQEYFNIIQNAGNLAILHKNFPNLESRVSPGEGHPSAKEHKLYALEQAIAIKLKLEENSPKF